MADLKLCGRRVLVVEDEYFIADDLRHELSEAGADVIGPASSVAQALKLLDEHERVDAAVLDVNLAGERVYPVADALRARQVPFVLATGYDARMVPDCYRDVPLSSKPIDVRQAMRDLLD